SGLPSWLSFDTATRTFSGTPTAPDVGTFTVVVRATDAAGASASASFVLKVVAVDHAPVAAPDGFTGDEDRPLSGNVLGNDSDADGDPLVASLLAPPAHGQVALAADGSFVYRPASDWSGTDGFSYRVSAGSA